MGESNATAASRSHSDAGRRGSPHSHSVLSVFDNNDKNRSSSSSSSSSNNNKNNGNGNGNNTATATSGSGSGSRGEGGVESESESERESESQEPEHTHARTHDTHVPHVHVQNRNTLMAAGYVGLWLALYEIRGKDPHHETRRTATALINWMHSSMAIQEENINNMSNMNNMNTDPLLATRDSFSDPSDGEGLLARGSGDTNNSTNNNKDRDERGGVAQAQGGAAGGGGYGGSSLSSPTRARARARESGNNNSSSSDKDKDVPLTLSPLGPMAKSPLAHQRNKSPRTTTGNDSVSPSLSPSPAILGRKNLGFFHQKQQGQNQGQNQGQASNNNYGSPSQFGRYVCHVPSIIQVP